MIGSRNAIKQIMQQMDNERILREADDDKTHLILELKRDLLKKDSEILLLKEDALTARKFKSELQSAETIIETLEAKLIDQSRDTERGIVALDQLDKYRSQLSEVTKYNHELILSSSSLENQLKGN